MTKNKVHSNGVGWYSISLLKLILENTSLYETAWGRKLATPSYSWVEHFITDCISYISAYNITYLNKRTLREEEFIMAHTLRIVYLCGKALVVGAWNSWSQCVHSQKSDKSLCSSFLLFIQSETSAYEMVKPTFYWSFPPNLNLSKQSLTHTPRISSMILSPFNSQQSVIAITLL